MNEGQLLLLWPGEVRRKREGDFGQIGPALLAGTNNCPSFINKISSTSYNRDGKITKIRSKSYLLKNRGFDKFTIKPWSYL